MAAFQRSTDFNMCTVTLFVICLHWRRSTHAIPNTFLNLQRKIVTLFEAAMIVQPIV